MRRSLFIAVLMISCGVEESVVPPLTENTSAGENISDAAISTPEAQYVGGEACQNCHPDQAKAWTGSHHDRAMETASEDTILGDFDDGRFSEKGVTWRFFRRADAFFVNTAGPDGALKDFEVLYSFGVDPLQQYLVALPGGRLQALTIAWDTRDLAAGGQRWFSLYPEDAGEPGDVLHWTGVGNNWNSMCAHCHSTNVRKNFDSAQATYNASWSDIDVACEACHGPASRHLGWAKSGADPSRDKGLEGHLAGDSEGVWKMNPETGIAFRDPPRKGDGEIDACAGCHSRRSVIREEADEVRFLDRHAPALLDEGLYFADGQMRDEVYVYGSFVQSRMYRAGVRCGDCHEPHSLELLESGNALCAQCHAPSVFAVRSHHQHGENSAGARCVECHMPSRTYMEVDERRDHSFRIPRPDLTMEMDIPNPCSGCHENKDAEWAAAEIAQWPGAANATREHYGQTIAAGRLGDAGAATKLFELAADTDSPPIARATAISLLSRYPGRELIEAIREGAADPEPLMRMSAARAADFIPRRDRIGLVGRLLLDSVRVVRIEAARTLAGADAASLGKLWAKALGPALEEYRHAQEVDADRPTAHVNLALLAASMGDPGEAEAQYRAALEVGPYFLPAYANFADLLRREGRDDEGESLLRKGLSVEPTSPELQHALGLLLVRLGRADEALAPLRAARDRAPEVARYAYVFGVALYSHGRVEESLAALREAHDRHGTDLSILEGLVSISREAGLIDESNQYRGKLHRLTQDPAEAARSRPGSAEPR